MVRCCVNSDPSIGSFVLCVQKRGCGVALYFGAAESLPTELREDVKWGSIIDSNKSRV